MNQYRTETFSSLTQEGILKIGDGHRAKTKELGGNGPIFLRAGSLTEQGFSWEGNDKFHHDATSRLSTKMGQPGDVVVTTKGNSTGRVGRVPDDAPDFVYSPHLSYWRSTQPKSLDPIFFYYWSRSHECASQIRSMAHGTDMAPYLSLSDQLKLKISLPPIKIQHHVGDLLRTLDAKIDVNQIITTTAIKISDSYFVSAQSEPRVREETFGTVATVYGGGTPKTGVGDYWDGDIPWATPTDATALNSPYLFETRRKITQLGLESCASHLYPAQSIFMTSRATIGAFAIPQTPAAVNQGFIVLVTPKSDLKWWLFHEMRSRVSEMHNLASGSTFLELSRKNFKAMPVRLPDDNSLSQFAATVDPLHKKACQATAESRTLAELRDTLLPQLMSGKLRVKDAERVVEDAV